MSEGLHMRYRHEGRSDASIGHGVPPEEFGRFANLGLLAVVLILAALWLAFPPAQLSSAPAAGTAGARGGRRRLASLKPAGARVPIRKSGASVMNISPLKLVGAEKDRVRENRVREKGSARRIDALSSLPIFLKLAGRRAVIVGDSEAALWKAELVAACGADVEIFAGREGARFRTLSEDPPAGSVRVHSRDWRQSDLAGAAIAIADLASDAEAERFADAARARGRSLQRRRQAALLRSAIWRDRQPIASPRRHLDGWRGAGFRPGDPRQDRGAPAARAQALGASRAAIGARLSRASASALPSGAPSGSASPIGRSPNPVSSRNRRCVRACSQGRRFRIGAQSAASKGRVTLVGAGPGDPDLLTLKAVRALQSAEVILYDQLVSAEVLDFARREAKRIMVGKTGHGPSCQQGEINELMLRLARQGKHVVRLKGGDPLIFGRASEEIEACRRAGIEVAIVPGITAAQGAAAWLGISLTQRELARRLQFVTGHAKDGKLPPDIDWRAIADPSATTALYMPRRTLEDFRDKAIENGLSPQTPAAAISRATRKDERKVLGTVSELPDLVARLEPDGPLLVLIGRGLETKADADRIPAEQPERRFVAGSTA